MPVPSFVSALGSATATQACTPGAELWVTHGGSLALTFWISAGICPQGGSVTAGPMVTPNGQTIQGLMGSSYWAGSTLFQDTRPLSGGGGGGSSGGGAGTAVPWEFTAEQQAEVYASMGAVFGALLAAMAAVWGVKQLLRVLEVGARWGD